MGSLFLKWLVCLVVMTCGVLGKTSSPLVQVIDGFSFSASGGVQLDDLANTESVKVRCASLSIELSTLYAVTEFMTANATHFWEVQPLPSFLVVEQDLTNLANITSYKLVLTSPVENRAFATRCSAKIVLRNQTVTLDDPQTSNPAVTPVVATLSGSAKDCSVGAQTLLDKTKWATNPTHDWRSLDSYSGKGGPRNYGDPEGCKTAVDTVFCEIAYPNIMWTGYCVPSTCDQENFKSAMQVATARVIADTANIEFGLVASQADKTDLHNFIAMLLSVSPEKAALLDILIDPLQQGLLAYISPQLIDATIHQLASSTVAGNCGWHVKSISPKAWIWIVPLLVIFVLCVCFSIVDRYRVLSLSRSNSSDEDEPLTTKLLDQTAQVSETDSDWKSLSTFDSIIKAWSLQRNWKALLSSRPGPLLFFDGMRFYAACWVIFGHVELFAIVEIGYQNFATINKPNDEVGSWWFQIVPGAFFAVDTFFWIAGFFSTFVMLKKFKKINTQKLAMGIPFLFLRRYLRLLPSVLLVLGAYWVLIPYLGSGPIWYLGDNKLKPGCDKHWWAEVFLITAWKNEWLDCLGMTWFLTCDFFYFACTPFILMIHLMDKRAGVVLVFSLLIAVTANYWHESRTQDVQPTLLIVTKGWNNVYFKPIIRAGPYIVGVLFGMVFDHLETTTRKYLNQTNGLNFRLSWRAAILCQVTGFTILCLCIFGLYDLNHNLKCSQLFSIECQDPESTWSRDTTDFYNSFTRPAFAVGLSLITSGWMWGPPAFWAWFFEWPIMPALGKLSFLAYLWHLFFVYWFYSSQSMPLYYSRLNVCMWFVAFVFIAFTAALVSHLFVEAPFGQLTEMLVMKLQTRLGGKNSEK